MTQFKEEISIDQSKNEWNFEARVPKKDNQSELYQKLKNLKEEQ